MRCSSVSEDDHNWSSNQVVAQIVMQKKASALRDSLFVPRVGLEPTRPNGHMALNHACLPISAPGRCKARLAFVTRLGLEPRTLSLKVRCSNQLSYQVFLLR